MRGPAQGLEKILFDSSIIEWILAIDCAGATRRWVFVAYINRRKVMRSAATRQPTATTATAVANAQPDVVSGRDAEDAREGRHCHHDRETRERDAPDKPRARVT
jgi:hypothetical protein